MVKRVVVGIASAALALALVGGVLSATASGDADGAGKKSKKFKPKQYAGDWSGSWANKTFKTKGDASMELETKGKKKFIGTFDLGGNAFGCADPDPRKVTMKKGKGKNSWNKKGFKVSYDNGQGPVKLKFKRKSQKLSGSGTSPCTPDITYTFSGKMTKRSVSADVEIFFQGSDFAKSSLRLKKG